MEPSLLFFFHITSILRCSFPMSKQHVWKHRAQCGVCLWTSLDWNSRAQYVNSPRRSTRQDRVHLTSVIVGEKFTCPSLSHRAQEFTSPSQSHRTREFMTPSSSPCLSVCESESSYESRKYALESESRTRVLHLWLEINIFIRDLFRQSPSALKRCLRPGKSKNCQ